MATPRLIIWPVLKVSTDPTGTAWRFTRDGKLGPGTPASWRLLSANNRELGRGTRSASAEELVAWLPSLQGRAGALVPMILVARGHTGWSWRATLDGAVIATSGRGYQRQREAAYSFSQFLRVLPGARIDDQARGSGQRSRQLAGPALDVPAAGGPKCDLASG